MVASLRYLQFVGFLTETICFYIWQCHELLDAFLAKGGNEIDTAIM